MAVVIPPPGEEYGNTASSQQQHGFRPQIWEENLHAIDLKATFYKDDTHIGEQDSQFVLEGTWSSQTVVLNARFQYERTPENWLHFRPVGLRRSGVGGEEFGTIPPYKLFGEYLDEEPTKAAVTVANGETIYVEVQRVYAPPPREPEVPQPEVSAK